MQPVKDLIKYDVVRNMAKVGTIVKP